MIGASANGSIDADSAHFTGRALLGSGHFSNVIFRNTVVGSVLDLSDSTADNVDSDQLETGKNVFLLCDKKQPCTQNRWQFRDIDLREARIGGGLNFGRASVKTLDAYRADVKGDVSFGDGQFDSAAFRSGRIGGTLRIQNTSLTSLDLTATAIGGDFILERKHLPLWRLPGALILRNVSVHAIEDLPSDCAAFGQGWKSVARRLQRVGIAN